MRKGLLGLLLVMPLLATGAIVNGGFYGTVQGNPYINGTAIQGYELIATRSCKDMSCVQQNIRFIDQQIGTLLAQRLAFVKRGAQLKNSVIVSDNVQQNPGVITQMTRQAQAQGVPPEISQAVFQVIDQQSQAYENKFHNLTPQPSPNSLGVPTQDVNNPVTTPTITPGQGVTPTITPGAPGQP
jgi:chorismate mutase